MDIFTILTCCCAALIGVTIASIFSLIPGLHIYNVIAFTMMIAFAALDVFKTLDPLITTCFIMGLVVGFSVLFTVSSQFFQPCDDSYRSMMLPHERFLFEGRGYEAAMVAAASNADVTLIERNAIGGSAVLTDVVPSKTLIATADMMTRFSEAVTSLSLTGWHSMFAGKATSDTSRGTKIPAQ